MKGTPQSGFAPSDLRNGERYAGEWLGNERHGRGVQTWPNGARQAVGRVVAGHGGAPHTCQAAWVFFLPVRRE